METKNQKERKKKKCITQSWKNPKHVYKKPKKRKGKKQKHSNLHVEDAQLIDVWLMPRSTGHKAPTKSKHARETTSKSDSKQKRLHCTEQAR